MKERGVKAHLYTPTLGRYGNRPYNHACSAHVGLWAQPEGYIVAHVGLWAQSEGYIAAYVGLWAQPEGCIAAYVGLWV